LALRIITPLVTSGFTVMMGIRERLFITAVDRTN
jgi:hypothetical protein